MTNEKDYENILHIDLVDRYLRRMGDKTIPDEAPHWAHSYDGDNLWSTHTTREHGTMSNGLFEVYDISYDNFCARSR